MSDSLVLPQSAVQLRHWRIALVLGVAGAVCGLLLLPYFLALMPQLRAKISVPLAICPAAIRAGRHSIRVGRLGGAHTGLEVTTRRAMAAHTAACGDAAATAYAVANGGRDRHRYRRGMRVSGCRFRLAGARRQTPRRGAELVAGNARFVLRRCRRRNAMPSLFGNAAGLGRREVFAQRRARRHGILDCHRTS